MSHSKTTRLSLVYSSSNQKKTYFYAYLQRKASFLNFPRVSGEINIDMYADMEVLVFMPFIDSLDSRADASLPNAIFRTSQT